MGRSADAQPSLAQAFFEAGDESCIYVKRRCRHRPCTAAQDVFCCHRCRYKKTCESKCGGAKRC